MKLIKMYLNLIMKSSVSRAVIDRPRSLEAVEKGRFTKSDIQNILKMAWHYFDDLYPNLPKEQTIGAKSALILACFSLALHKSLLKYGLTKEYSMQLIADISWFMYKKMGKSYLFIAKLSSRDKLKRLKKCADLYMKFPFNPPGYDMRHVDCDYPVALDVFKCPVADYFIKNNEVEFCKGTWCSLDYSLAEIWGGHLKRTTYIPSGDDRCDFRWTVM